MAQAAQNRGNRLDRGWAVEFFLKVVRHPDRQRLRLQVVGDANSHVFLTFEGRWLNTALDKVGAIIQSGVEPPHSLKKFAHSPAMLTATSPSSWPLASQL